MCPKPLSIFEKGGQRKLSTKKDTNNQLFFLCFLFQKYANITLNQIHLFYETLVCHTHQGSDFPGNVVQQCGIPMENVNVNSFVFGLQIPQMERVNFEAFEVFCPITSPF